jgi:hypothetical protein
MCCKSCYHFDTCSAPLCPLDAESLEHGVWYADEDICDSRKLEERPRWLAMQKRIAKRQSAGYFTVGMLSRKGLKSTTLLKGIDPDKPEAAQLRSWLKNHGSALLETTVGSPGA